MEFNNLRLTESSVCDCMSGSQEDTERTFVRRITENKSLRIRHFKTELEKPDKVLVVNNCIDFCKYRELSINNISDYDEEEVVASYLPDIQKQLIFAPKKEFYYCKFRFKSGAGKTKHTPQHGHISHYDFYKSDEFSIEHIDILSLPILIACPLPTPVQEE